MSFRGPAGRYRVRIGIAFLLAVLELGGGSYEAEIQQWRKDREARLKADDGWLTVAGLFWLKEGENRVGTASSNDVLLPSGSAPEKVGAFVLRNGQTTFVAKPGVTVTANGKPVRSLVMRPDSPGPPDVIAIGRLTIQVINRGKRYGIRLKDKNSKFRREFTGLSWFPVDESYRVTARFVPYNPSTMIPVTNVLGDTEQSPNPGYAVFTIGGVECRLHPVLEDERLFFIFRDLTAGKETYPSGRFLYSDMPRDGKVILDFNKAYNPPCAFTPYTTCPLPPPQNRLPVAIRAGEKKYHN